MEQYNYITKQQVRNRFYFFTIVGALLYSVCFSLPYFGTDNTWIEGLKAAGLLVLGFGFGFAYGLKNKVRNN